jgi:hypothetical protein
VFKIRIKYSLIFFAGILLHNCKSNETPADVIVAQVGENKLYQSELAEIIPGSIDKSDSTLMADDYIKKWVKQELLIQKANENLTPEQKDMTKEVREYRNSLIIYKYKNELMRQRMDTTVTKEQIEQYYYLNSVNFNLTTNIVKAIFIKIPNEVANPSLLKQMAENNTEEGMNELRDYCLQYAKGFDIFTDNWVDFDVVKNNLPSEITDEERFLSGNNLIELKDSNYYYLVSILDYKLKNNPAPLDFVKNNIKNLILNQRKIEFLKQVEENIYKEGVRQNKFKIYTEN